MFDWIIAYSIRQKFIIGLFVFGIIAVGAYSFKHLPIDALPDITNNQVQIITTSPNLATQEVELFITYPIELSVKSIPEIVELRSISRFGLSLVTVVFEEGTDIYWARTQITERLKEAEEQIPEGFGRPTLAPISTGLGEIYQYTVSAKEGFEEEFDIMELRSVQDWIIVPQLIGTKGVAEVNTLGGILKEYEVAIDPDKIKSMGITMSEIFTALKKNNENTGGAYIDKKPYAYFIRSIGMVSSLEDISKIVVKTNNNIPILIRDIAEVQFGSTVRYGATTRNGEGEVVNGMVMMLKGENSAEIVQIVKEKIKQIEPTLPEGVKIEPYLDRSKLVNKATSTVRNNLIEGALIVIFILVLLIGNWRAGLIVASVIPLALLFAVSMMRLFGVSGNLMSLGAIDFGLIVDGAVIIVEAIVHRLNLTPSGRTFTDEQMDEEVYQAASGIRSSAAFGEIIILIVYLPILALVGIEGKMFTPMAQTVAFAILGAFILSLTYIPMMSALCLSKKTGHKENFSDKIIAFIQKLYDPALRFSLNSRRLVIVLTLLLFGSSLYVFSTLGGEFIPTLSEGDIATHIIIPAGSSLQQEIETCTKAEKLLLANFPEIEQIVSKIGSAEVPTDPMPMEVADVMIIMKDKKEWVTASSKLEMFEKMEKVLNDLPGVTTEFSQPIQMRFNELMTGVRSDVGIKIFGNDLELLVAYGDELVELIHDIEGVEDARAETVSGLPQITVDYDKDKLALYGLNVSDLNAAVSMGFAGTKAGVVYEEEERYDLVVRLASTFRQDITNIKNLYITLPSGNQIPLEQVADVSFKKGPAQISREDGKRRITVGFNVRGRDVESVVSEIQNKIAENITLPTGYYIDYSGQFENLKRAKSRLSIAVPLALLLIFILLYFTFNSVKQTLLIFTAIPLSAIGGVFALWLRDMPFSISAGIGFIALFGVAVLNGIVLISYFNQLKKEGMKDIIERIKIGTAVRLRPVIMTAAVASFGFLPMALSTTAGAEVQKPLATVVIGGLITATLLTLVILPILYYFSERNTKKIYKSKSIGFVISIIALSSSPNYAQSSKEVTLEQAITLAQKNSPSLNAFILESERLSHLENGSYIVPKTEIQALGGQLNSNSLDQSYSIRQRFNPFISKSNKKVVQAQLKKNSLEVAISQNEIVHELSSLWNEYGYLKEELILHKKQEQRHVDFAKYANKKYETGEGTFTEKSSVNLKLENTRRQVNITESKMIHLIGEIELFVNKEINIAPFVFEPSHLDTTNIQLESSQNYLLNQQGATISRAQANLKAAQLKPDFSLGYFIQSFEGEQIIDNETKTFNNTPQFHGVSLGVNIPIFNKGTKASKNAAAVEILVKESQGESQNLQLARAVKSLENQIEIEKSNLQYYSEIAIPNTDLINNSAKVSYENGQIGYLEYHQVLDLYYEIYKSHLMTIKVHNQKVIDLQFIIK